ncbi:MAG: glycine cleavage system protein GcvH [Nocardioidaceae bacterium]|nr:glycine cleavage system protein GcvH [Nocardioidaceae bacterium]
MHPEDLHYSAEHEWVRADGDGPVRIGITDYAQDQLGDIVYIQLPEVGDTVQAGSAVGELESTKSVSDLFAPVTGTVTAVNEALSSGPELCNSDPYGDGWIFEVDMTDRDQLAGLMAATDYEATITSQ